MIENNGRLPGCFGDLETVFPKTENGLRNSPESCVFGCHHKTECLKLAMNKGSKGAIAQEEYVDRAYKEGIIGFFKRWSRKKNLKKKY